MREVMLFEGVSTADDLGKLPEDACLFIVMEAVDRTLGDLIEAAEHKPFLERHALKITY
eukprot:CAMPEP_0170492970 /NCGR_PEP_ID=MMETSP0208-20121228/13146_1 /TAXON_ID=197538 /ORGANISM="Strombidium inclinatum, Strain S3" /LENGTH=58 /DNA_ID=CAMNT_0010768817 /DNA_START=332 /DNA_END=508 /DNA_ORIENTATION=+